MGCLPQARRTVAGQDGGGWRTRRETGQRMNELTCARLGAWGLGNLGRYGQVWKPCGPIASASRPTPGRGRCAARGPHRGSPWAGRGGRRDQQGGGGAGTWGGAGRQPARQPALSIPDGWCWAANRWPQYRPGPGRHLARPIQQAAWQRPQGRQGRPGQARQGQSRQAQGQGQVGRPRRLQASHVYAFRDGHLQVNPTRPYRVDVHISTDPAALLLILYRQQSQWRHIAAGRLNQDR
jgi:hypothetical protein